MTGRKFFNSITGGKKDVIKILLRLLDETGSAYCVIGGLAANAYAEPVVSLDLDIVIVSDKLDALRTAAEKAGMKAQDFEHSVNLSIPGSDLRVQIQTDPRYQEFIPRGERREVLGYKMAVVRMEDVLLGKIRDYSDETRQKSKRQKDLADIMRLVEAHPELKEKLPTNIAALVDSI